MDQCHSQRNTKSLQSQKNNMVILVSNFALFICHKEVYLF